VTDGYLHHDRPIARPADDPVVRVVAGVVRPVRLGRGTAPQELDLPQSIGGADSRRWGIHENHHRTGVG
jgi:hydrogenase maturation protein HypF